MAEDLYSEGDGRVPAPLIALTIAGFDPSSGAGATADLKTFAAHRVYGVACLTALTVQSTQGVRSVHPADARVVEDTLACLAADTRIDGVKLGMLGKGEVVRVVCAFLRRLREASAGGVLPIVVLDPVLRSSSGSLLLDEAGVGIMEGELIPLVDWITPNLDELSVLTGLPVRTRNDVAAAAQRLRAMAADVGNRGLNIVVTGGHLEPPHDFLLTAAGEEHWIGGERVATRATHGTGCAYASALLCVLMSGAGPQAAATQAKNYVQGAMRAAQRVGKGKGPLHHLFQLDELALFQLDQPASIDDPGR